MRSILKKFYSGNRAICNVFFLGLLLRLIFTFFIAPFYFNRPNIHFDNDTTAWMAALSNLIYQGEFTVMLNNEFAAYCRMPGYSLFLAPAFELVSFSYYLQGIDVKTHTEMWYSVLKITAFLQIVLDSISIYFIYYISKKTIKQHKVAIIGALLYAFYPFVIVWNPVCYSEIPSIFFGLLALVLVLASDRNYIMAFAGAALGFSVLNRPQFALLAPLMIFFFYQKYGSFNKQYFTKLFVFFVLFTCTYGAWPIRNYIRFNKVIITQDLRGFDNWNDDVIAFMQYIYSVKSEWQPQFSNILQNKQVDFPEIAYSTAEDSLKLERAVYLAKNCGRGFSEWGGYWKATIPIFDTANDCSKEVARLFNELRQSQIEKHPFNFYVKVPLQNLNKAIFKSGLSDNASFARKLGGYLFYFRTLLILTGIAGLFLMFRKKELRPIALFIGSFFGMLYFYLCFGTSPQCRNIEMRYFLQADVLMLIPAAFIFCQIKGFSNFVQRFLPPAVKEN